MKILKTKSKESADKIPKIIHGKHSRQKNKVIYPDSDGKPMADNTKQFNWIQKLRNLEKY